ncbi:MAG TPA: S53 family peptidase [Terriglobales bacterium]|nr:S53 family peptidase [Terriglobales bacterium]
MKRRWVLVFLLVLVAAGSPAQTRSRIPDKIDEARTPLRGNVHRLAQARFDRGKVADALQLPRITLFFNRTAAQQAELDALLEQQQDPSSPNYHKWLTVEQYADRFGISDADIAKTAQWLQAQGFSIVERPAGRAYLAFSGTAAQVRAAFGAEIHTYAVNGEVHFANAADPSLPRVLADVTLGIRGLHDFRPKARAVRRPQPKFTSSISGNHFLTPDDFATIYHLKPLYDQGIDGTGQTLAVMGQTDILLPDIATFRSLSGLPANAPVVQKIPGYVAGVNSNDIAEADLDVEWAGAVARKATIIFVTPGNAPSLGAFDSMAYAISNNVASVLSISYGACESFWTASDITTFTGLFQQANSQGQTVVGPSGDTGAGDCESFTATSATHGLAVDFPASSAFVTGVGGTMFNEGNTPSQFWASANNSFNGSALSYIPETTWNETTANGGQLAGGGGGKSTLQICDAQGQNCVPNSKPVWQPMLDANDTMRDVPDLSLAAAFVHDGYLICASNQSPADCTNGFRRSDTTLDAIGGTSAGAPTFAGMVALLNQKMGGPQGNVNPMLYALAANSTDAFHDVTSGDNTVPCSPGFAFLNNNGTCPQSGQIGYSATVGYDLATGLGTVDAYNLISELASGTTSTPAPPDFTMSNGGSSTITVTHGTSQMVTVTLGGTTFNGPVTFSCIVSTSLAGVTCTPPSPMSPPGNATFTITASSTAKLLPLGATPSYFAWSWGGGTLVVGLLLGAGVRRKRNKAATRALFLTGAVLLLLAAMLAGCGGGSSSFSPPPPPSFTPESGAVVLQGVNNADVHIVPITVNVN